MTTECSDGQLVLHGLGRREVVARFDAAPITSDGGGVLRQVDRRVNLLGRLAWRSVSSTTVVRSSSSTP